MDLKTQPVEIEIDEEALEADVEKTGGALEKLKEINWMSVFVEKGNLSLGRLSFWVVFVIMNYMWVAEKNVQESMLMVLMVLMSYNLGKKFTNIAENYFSKPKESSNEGEKVEP